MKRKRQKRSNPEFLGDKLTLSPLSVCTQPTVSVDRNSLRQRFTAFSKSILRAPASMIVSKKMPGARRSLVINGAFEHLALLDENWSKSFCFIAIPRLQICREYSCVDSHDRTQHCRLEKGLGERVDGEESEQERGKRSKASKRHANTNLSSAHSATRPPSLRVLDHSLCPSTCSTLAKS